MIEFKYKLPSWRIDDDKIIAQYNVSEFVVPILFTTSGPDFNAFMHILHNNVYDSRRLLLIDDKYIPTMNNWIRDDVHMMKCSKHFDYRLKDFLEFIINTQTEEGFYLELVKPIDDGHHLYVDKSCTKLFEKDNLAATRLEVEADVEYLVVEGVLQYYRSSGDIEFVKKVLPSLEKAIKYMITSPKRFSKEYGLIIRPYTIDTWDFTNDLRSNCNRRILPDETMCAMHGDNSGVYAAMLTLARFNSLIGGKNEKYWKNQAAKLKDNVFKYLWNGKFFIHQFIVKGTPIDELENVRLSLSNPYDINRGITNQQQSESIIKEYQARKKTTDAFLEYFAIDPCYKKFNKYEPGMYVNGSISPFTAGELSLASFDNGYSSYGYEIIKNMMGIALKEKSISFLYNRHFDGTQNDQGPSAWGAATLVNAVDEGLLGIKDLDCLYKNVFFSPKLTITEHKQARYFTGYEQSNVFVDVNYAINDEGFRYDFECLQTEKINCKLLITPNKDIKRVVVNGIDIDFKVDIVAEDKFVVFDVINNKKTEIICLYR